MISNDIAKFLIYSVYTHQGDKSIYQSLKKEIRDDKKQFRNYKAIVIVKT